MAGRPLRKVLSALLSLCMGGHAFAVEVHIPRGRSGGNNGGQAGAVGSAGGALNATLTTTLGLSVDLAGSIRPLAGAPALAMTAWQPLLAAPISEAALLGPAPAPAAVRLEAASPASGAAAPSIAEIKAAVNPPAGSIGHDPSRPGSAHPRVLAGVVSQYRAFSHAQGLDAAERTLQALAAQKLTAKQGFEGGVEREDGAAPVMAAPARKQLPLSLLPHYPGLPLGEGRGRLAPLPKELQIQNGRMHYLFDVRSSRGGNGDVAAAYLTAFDMLDRVTGRVKPPDITFVADDAEFDILSRLTGRDVRDGDLILSDHVRVYRQQSIPHHLRPANVVFTLAAPSGGHWSNPETWTYVDHGSFSGGRIPVNANTVLVTQTVFGNTEAHPSEKTGSIWVKGRRMNFSHAGLAKGHAGIYTDPVARALRGRLRIQVEEFLMHETRDDTASAGVRKVRAYLEGKALVGSQPGLAYGITAESTKPQFERYLAGLAGGIKASARSYVLFTPSGFSLDDVKNPNLRQQVVVIERDGDMPAVAERGKIYVVKTGNLPHPVFVGLMALARPPPVLAGDGAMSAALGLGRPFVMTQVGHNLRNVSDFRERLKEATRGGAHPLIDAVFGVNGPDLSRVLELENLTEGFERVADAVPSLTDTLLQASLASHDVSVAEAPMDEALEGVDDPVLVASAVMQRMASGSEDARRFAARAVRRTPTPAFGLLLQELVGMSTERVLMLRWLARLNYGWVNRLIARFSLFSESPSVRRYLGRGRRER